MHHILNRSFVPLIICIYKCLSYLLHVSHYKVECKTLNWKKNESSFSLVLCAIDYIDGH